ncbi:hypothetical protein LCGC14_2383590, partial [marine sediment metagenome]
MSSANAARDPDPPLRARDNTS